ncbi:hypothetical protein [Streptomyces syringium]|uniref:hypothetical protein n=1 Tax=Streptomyces syringium TaxID=76729 RepID=UPI0033DBAE38
MTVQRCEERAVQELLRAVRILASDADVQIEYVQRLGVGPDEMALEFDDAFRQVAGVTGMGFLPEGVMEAARPIDDQLQRMTSLPEDVWSKCSVRSSSEWQKLRLLARAAGEGIQRLMIT